MPGTMTTITVEGKPVDAYVAVPEGQGPFPGVAVAMHVFGVDRFVRGKCDELAQAGYIAVAPYLFHREPTTNDALTGIAFDDPARRDTAMPMKDRLVDAQIQADMLAAVGHIRSLPQASGRVGVTGFCIGGRIAYLMGVTSQEFGAVGIWYGTDPHLPWGHDGASPQALTKELACPVVGFFGNEDANPSPEMVDSLGAALRAAGKDYEFHRYDGAPHAFNDPFNPVRFTPKAAADSWPKFVSFLDRYLKG
jgi:carboxymethylenebutenolidase